MPSDDITVDPQGTVEGDEPTSTPTASPAPTPPAVSFTPEQLSAALREAVAAGNRDIMDLLSSLPQNAPAPEGAKPPAHPEPNELAEQLLTDPKGTMSREMTDLLKREVAPMLFRQYEVDRDERIEAASVEVDERFGEGYFDENIRPRLVGKNGSLSSFPINQQADPMVIESAISGIVGNLLRDPENGPKLEEAMQKAAKARHERNVSAPPNMMGPGRPYQGRPNSFTPEMKRALAGFQEAGVKITEADVKAALSRPKTADAWQEATK